MRENGRHEHTFTYQELEEQAVQMALAGHWDRAAQLNRRLLERYPDNVDALNRLGKALMELDQYEKAQAAYSRALELDPHNRIARRNLERLTGLMDDTQRGAPSESERRERIPLDLFISESGKSAIVPVRGVVDPKVRQKLSRGEIVRLVPSEQTVLVETDKGEKLGRLDARVGRRLAEFIQIGNRYAAAIAQVDERGLHVFIRETQQHPRLLDRLSFPPTEASQMEVVRPYIRDWGLRLYEDLDEDLDEEEAEEGEPVEEVDLEVLEREEEIDLDELLDEEDL